jgi:nucleotide-binding universal stress UspA family protein
MTAEEMTRVAIDSSGAGAIVLPSLLEEQVMEMMQFYRHDLIQRVSKLHQALRASAQNHLEALAQSVRETGVKTQSHILEDAHTGEALVTYAEQNRCDLVMTSDLRHSVIDRMLLGSTSRFVLRHAASSVLIVRGNEKED